MMMRIFSQQDSLVGVKKKKSKAPQVINLSDILGMLTCETVRLLLKGLQAEKMNPMVDR
jgi:hypothetical protein